MLPHDITLVCLMHVSNMFYSLAMTLTKLHLIFGSALSVNLFTLELHFKRCNSYGEAPCSMEIMIVLYHLHFTNIPFSHPAYLSKFSFNMHRALSFELQTYIYQFKDIQCTRNVFIIHGIIILFIHMEWNKSNIPGDILDLGVRRFISTIGLVEMILILIKKLYVVSTYKIQHARDY